MLMLELDCLILISPFASFSFYRCTFDPTIGGEMSQQEYVRFLKNDSRTR